MRVQSRDRESRDVIGDGLGRLRSVGPIPVRGPVQRAEERPRGDRRVGRAQHAAADAVGDERPDAALVSIAFGDDRGPQTGRQRMDLEVRRGSFELVDQAQDVRHGEIAKPRRERTAGPPRTRQRVQHPIEGAALTEVEQLVLAFEIVVQDPRREVGGGRDVTHAGRREADGSERSSGGAEDLDAARLGSA
jgi:hypothetical protein